MMPRWWIRRRLRKCGCDLCVRHLAMIEEIWAAEGKFAKALHGEPRWKPKIEERDMIDPFDMGSPR